MRPTLRVRVVLAACGAIVLAVVVLGVAVSVLVEHQLRSTLDRSLHDRAAEIARLSVSAPAVLTAPGALDARIGGQQLSVEVLDRRGRLVARSVSLGGSLLPTSLVRRVIADGRSEYGAGSLGKEELRLYVAPLPAIGGEAAGGAVIVAASTGDIAETIDRLHLFAFLSAVAAVLLAGGAGLLLVRRALRPLERLSAGAVEIERTADASRRLPEPGTGDEVGRLAPTLNRMLGALERSREGERRFLADASHELRSPVTALRGNVDYLRRHGHDEAALTDLAADAERLSALIDDLLVLSREDATQAGDECVRLDELARDAAGADPRIVVEAPAPVAVRGDRAALRAGAREPGRERAAPRPTRWTDHDRRAPGRRRRSRVRARRRERAHRRGGRARVRALLARPPGRPRLRARPGDREGDREAPRRAGDRRRRGVRDRAARSQRTLKHNRYT